MDIRYFESLISVADLGSISHAAKSQNLTSAAVGQRIACLEKHFGVLLLDRTTHKASPTPACDQLLPLARKMVDDFHRMTDSLTTTGLSGKFYLGSISTVLSGIIPSAIRSLAEVAPELVLQVKPGTSNSLFEDLSDRKLDAAVICLPSEELPIRFTSYLIRNEPLVLLSRVAKGRTIREKLERNAYICYDSQSWGGAKAAAYLVDHNIGVEPVYELDALETIEKLVLQDMGVSLVPSWCGFDPKRKKLKATVIRDERYARQIALVTHRHHSRGLIVEKLLSSLRAGVEAL